MEDSIVLAEVSQNISCILCKAAVDEEFRAQCLEDCAKAYRTFSGKELPKQFLVRFIEEGQEAASGELPFCVLPQYLPPTWLG